MLNFDFHNPTRIIFGKDRLQELPKNVKSISDKILLVYGKGSIKRNGLHGKITRLLEESGITIVELGGVDPNPRIKSVREGALLCRENDLGFILAVGGGSVIDCAKGIAMAACYDGDPWDFYEGKVHPEKALPIGSVLTLSASGSEMNCGTVISNPDSEEKNGYGHYLLYPAFSFLDPELTFSVPARQTAAGAADIIAHCFEFYFDRVNSGFIQNRIAESIMKTCIRYAPVALNESENYETRANLMWAGSMALNGVIRGGKIFDGFNHITEHTVSAIYDLTHGVGLSILMPHWLGEILDDDTAPKLSEYACNVWNESGGTEKELALKGIKRTKGFLQDLGLPTRFSDAGIPADRFEDIARKSLSGNETLGQFKPLDFAGIMRVLERAK